jgi:hypothetical protein
VRVHDVAATARFLGALRAGVPAPEAAGDAGASPAAYAEMERAILGALEGRE